MNGWAPQQPAMPQQQQVQPVNWDGAQSGNQWQAAFQQLVGSPTMPSQSQVWAAPSPGIPNGQTLAQAANWQQAQQASAPWVAPISQPQATQAYSPEAIQTIAQQAAVQQIQASQIAAQQAALAQAQAQQQSGSDAYLDNISNESLEILSHFGAEAPVKLNTYACKVEDALLESLQHQKGQGHVIAEQQDYIEKVQSVLNAAQVEREGMLTILSDPNELSTYVQQFFGADGPYPVYTPAEQAQAALREGMVQEGAPLMPRAENPRMAYERPQMPMPQPGAGANSGRLAGNGSTWNQFSQLMDVAPDKAWQALSALNPEDVRAKVLFMEG